MTAPLPPLVAGRFGRYQLIRELARGGMGVVWLARDPSLDRLVAVKVLMCDDAGRFRREAELLARLRHPGIVTIHEYGEITPAAGRPVCYLVMALVSGGTLADRLCRPELPPKLDLFEQVVRAVAHAHERGVVHRDLKPSNVLIDGHGRALVTDFGLARAEDMSRLTRTGAMLGTAHYMSPEQLLGDPEAVGPGADVWALGVMLYELLAGRLPFDASVAWGLFAQIRTLDPPAPRAAAPARDVPRALSRVCQKALRKSVRRRYPDAAALLADLQRARAGGRVWIGPARKGLGAVSLLALLLLAGLSVAAWRLRSAARIRSVASRPARSPARSAPAARRRGDVARLERLVGQARAGAYVATFDMAGALAVLRRELGRLEREVAEPERRARQWSALGVGWHLAGHPRRARAALTRALRLDPTDAWARRYLGQVLLGEVLLGVFHRTGFVRRADRDRAQWRELVALMQRFGESALDRHLAAAVRALATASYRTAERLCEEGLRRFGRQPGAELLLAVRGYLCPADQVGQAMGAVLAIRPHDTWSRYRRAAWHFGRGRHRRAAAELTVAIRLHPGLWYLHHCLGEVREAQGRLDEALRHLDRAVALQAGWGVPHHARGRVREAMGQLERALADHRASARVSPDYWQAWCAQGRVLRRLGRTEQAVVVLERALRMAPGSVVALLERAMIYQAARDHVRAHALFRRVTQVQPEQWRGWYGVAYELAQLGRYDEALGAYAEAIGRQGKEAALWNGRGVVRERLGQHALAAADYERAVALQPGLARAWLNLGLTRIRLGRREGGIAAFERGLALVEPSRRQGLRAHLARALRR